MEDGTGIVNVVNGGMALIFFILLFIEMMVYGVNAAIQNRHEE